MNNLELNHALESTDDLYIRGVNECQSRASDIKSYVLNCTLDWYSITINDMINHYGEPKISKSVAKKILKFLFGDKENLIKNQKQQINFKLNPRSVTGTKKLRSK